MPRWLDEPPPKPMSALIQAVVGMRADRSGMIRL
jgi:hypothetical protein